MTTNGNRANGLFFEDLPEGTQRIIERVVIAAGEYCPCCGRRKPTKNIRSHLDRPGSWIHRERVLFIFEEIVRRIGFEEAARQIPYSRPTLRKLLNNDKPYVRKSTVEKAIALLRELRTNDTVYSRKSIKYGAKARGLEPNPPQHHRDYFKSSYDYETEQQREHRKREQQKREDNLERLIGY